MRALILCLGLAACTPDIVSGAYLCGAEMVCPDGQACNGTEDEDQGLGSEMCVLEDLAMPFSCTSNVQPEPDNAMDQGRPLAFNTCIAAAMSFGGCIDPGDTGDWVTFVAPSICPAVSISARLRFPVAYEGLALELWDYDGNAQLATDKECVTSVESGVGRCLDFALVPGKKYALKVSLNGGPDCGGNCAYNRYTLSIQLAAPG
ncbi:MAG TPA: hypothetical protein VIV40_15755 [Kofleriaceae bacterium]